MAELPGISAGPGYPGDPGDLDWSLHFPTLHWSLFCYFHISLAPLWARAGGSWGDRSYLDCLPAQFWCFPEAFWFLSAESTRILVIKLKQKRILHLAWLHCLTWIHFYDVLNIVYIWIRWGLIVLHVLKSQSLRLQCHSLHLKSQCHTLHRSSIILGLPWTFVCSKKTQKFTSRRWRLCFTQCSWRLQQSSPCRLHV